MKHVHVGGVNADVDSASNEDIWSQGGTYPFPATAAATTIESAEAADDGDPAGTGARTVLVEGLDANLNEISEIATMNGTNAVTLANQYLRINRVEVLTAGSGGENAGLITVKHSSTVIGAIEAGLNKSRSAIFTAPSGGYRSWVIKKIHCSITNAVNGAVTFQLFGRTQDGVWRPKWTPFALHGQGTVYAEVDLPSHIYVEPGEDLRLEADASADNSAVAGGFDLIGSSAPM